MLMATQILSTLATALCLFVGWKLYRRYQFNQAYRKEEKRLAAIAQQEKQLELDRQQAIVDWHRTTTQALQAAIMRDHHYTVRPDGTLIVAHPPRTQVQVTEQVEQQKQIATPASVPGRYDMREVWNTGFRPSTSQIWLAKGAADGIIVPANKLLHSIATGPTGGGKTNIVRMELMQLIYIRCEVVLMDIHYAPIKEDEDGNPIDWRPIVTRLAQPPIFNMKTIIQWMKWLAYTELESRIARQRSGQPIGRPIFFTIAELPAVLDEAGDEIADPLAKVLRQGRQYQIFFVGDSQDLLTKTLHMSTGPREAFRTGFYTGGDATTAKALLDLPNGVKLSEEGLGQQGLVYLKTAVHPYTQARVGWASNESLYELFQTPASERIGMYGRSYHHSNMVDSTADSAEDFSSSAGKKLSYGRDPEGAWEEGRKETDTSDDLSVKQALRDIGKRLKNGDDRAKILQSYGATSGRANQEIGAVIDAMIEQIESETN